MCNNNLCVINSDAASCSSVMFDAHGIEYSQVCGKIIAYQDASPDAFGGNFLLPRDQRTVTIDENYLDGISLTHGQNQRRHIWSFAAATDEAGFNPLNNCPCTNVQQSSPHPPNFVGNDYFCDTASEHFSFVFYPNDPLWDGEGCGPANTCCSLNNPPWFRKQLPSATSNDIKMRLCCDQRRNDEDVPIESIELYVQ